jgi:very-short-patch-repair endonuclease
VVFDLMNFRFRKFILSVNLPLPSKEPVYRKHLYQGISAETHEKAKHLRHKETDAEKKLWSLLRNRQLVGKKFRRQHPFTDFILDFYCHEHKLGIELDGNHHLNNDVKEYDASRSRYIALYGVTIIRFMNKELMNEPEKVLEKICAHLK